MIMEEQRPNPATGNSSGTKALENTKDLNKKKTNAASAK